METKNKNHWWLLFIFIVLIISLGFWFQLRKINTKITSDKKEQINMNSIDQNNGILDSKKQEGQYVGIKLSSDVFEDNQFIPGQYSYKGGNINPPLSINNIPEKTKSLALIVEDPDAPAGVLAHWLVWNIPAETSRVDENSVPPGSIQGLNAFGHNRYDGPYPPSGTHRYFFKIYALDIALTLDKNSKKVDLENAIGGHILSEASIIGLYSK